MVPGLLILLTPIPLTFNFRLFVFAPIRGRFEFVGITVSGVPNGAKWCHFPIRYSALGVRILTSYAISSTR